MSLDLDELRFVMMALMAFCIVLLGGILSGFVFFITVHFETDETIPVVSSADEESHWANSFCMVSWLD